MNIRVPITNCIWLCFGCIIDPIDLKQRYVDFKKVKKYPFVIFEPSMPGFKLGFVTITKSLVTKANRRSMESMLVMMLELIFCSN